MKIHLAIQCHIKMLVTLYLTTCGHPFCTCVPEIWVVLGVILKHLLQLPCIEHCIYGIWNVALDFVRDLYCAGPHADILFEISARNLWEQKEEKKR